jgi:hypothetical protein
MSVSPGKGVAASPWKPMPRLVLAVLLGLGAAGLVAGYAGTSGTLQVSHQVVWVNVAGAALVMSGAGVALFLTAGRRAIGRRRLALFGNAVPGGAAPAGGGSGAAADLVASPAMTRYHRAYCSFVAGKTGLRSASSAAHEKSGRAPCGVCLPGDGGR